MNTTKRATTLGKAENPSNNSDNRGDTFWILVYVFMAFAIFEIFCVAAFFIYRHKKRKLKNKTSPPDEPQANYDNLGMGEVSGNTRSPPPYPENIQLYENDSVESRYSSIQRAPSSLRQNQDITLIENGIPTTVELTEQLSRASSRISRARSIIVLPKDCIIVHASGSRTSRHSALGDENRSEIGIKNIGGPMSDDNRSLYSWESSSTYYKTSTDEDYVSGSNRIAWEEDSLYEEPDKIIPMRKGKPTSPFKSFGLERLFALQESVINNTVCVNQDNESKVNEEIDKNNKNNEHNHYEHIYETAENAREGILSYYENAYDLPEDALAICLGKPNKFALKHVLHEDATDEHDAQPTLNLGMEFVNNKEEIEEGEDVKIRPSRQSTLFLHNNNDREDNRTSVC